MASLLYISVLCAMLLDQCLSEKSPNAPLTYSATDLKGQMFSVNRDGWVKLQSTAVGTLSSFTVCMRQMFEEIQSQRFFTLNLGSRFISLTGNIIEQNFTVGTDSETFSSFFYMDSGRMPWTSLCSTWASNSGMAQVWMNGNPSVRKGLWRYQVFTGLPVLAIYGFVGQVTDVHVWNYVLSPTAILTYSKGAAVLEGTVLNWRNVQYTTTGYVILEPMQFSAGLGNAKQQVTKKMWRGNSKRGGGVVRKATEGTYVL